MKKLDKVKLSEEEIIALKAIIDDFELEDQSVRERQIRQWKRFELLWMGYSNVWWDSVAHDWRIYGYGDTDGAEGNDNAAGYYDKTINVFRAYLETIIAALSTTVPPVKCIPDDADNVNDVLTAKGGSKIASLIYRHNDAPLLWIRGLWVYCLQGVVAAYNYTDEDKAYGEVGIQDYEDSEVEVDQKLCPNCGMVLGQEEVAASEEIKKQEEDEFDPGDDDVLLGNVINSGKLLCPACMIDIDPELKRDKVVVTRLTGITNQPKSRQCIEVNGGLYVKVPVWARNQADCPYLSYNFETHYSNIAAKYPEIEDKLDSLNAKISSPDGNQLYERWGRLSPIYAGEYPLNTPTERHWWLRNSAFNTLNDDDLADKLKRKFPNGCYVILVNDEFVKACNQNLDDHWTLTFNPMSNSVHYDPLGSLLTAIQEITNELVSLELQCIEHSIPMTFASPKRLNFEQFRNTEVVPGAIYPTLPGNNKAIGEDFYTLQTATVSPEMGPFGAKINEMGQFVSGALPSLFGGAQSSSSRTASQYAMSRNQALQRLQTPWKMINFWWKNIFAKVIPAYIKNMLEDERIVSEQGKDNFINTIIHKAQLDGKIGDIQLEAPDGLPQSLDQIRDTVKELMAGGNQQILEAIGMPQNLPILADVIGLNDFVLPGEDDRQKQYEEINVLLNSAPIPTAGIDPMTGQPGEQSSVQPELNVDNHKIEAEICRNWLVGERGRQAKTENPEGYKNILLHLQAHMQMLAQLMQPAPKPQPQGANKAQPSGGSSKVAQLRPVPGASNG